MVRYVSAKRILFYKDSKYREPFTNWLNEIKDQSIRRRVLARLRRLEQGNYGDCKSLGQELYELRLFFSSGYRIYFGETDNEIVVVLCGGDKSSQEKDIEKARFYWKDYKDE